MTNRIRVSLALILAAAQGPQPASGALEVQPTAPTERPAVLMLSVDDPSRHWTQLVTQGFHEAAQVASEPPVVYHEYVDVTRVGESEYDTRFREWLRWKYRNTRIDLLVVSGQESVGFLARGRGEPWPGVPAVYAEFDALTIDISKSLPGAAGIIPESPVGYVLETIKRLMPATERVAVVYGASERERARFEAFANGVRAAKLGLEPLELTMLPMADLRQRVAQLPERTVMLLTIEGESAGRSLPPGRPCELISATANRPLFSLWRFDLGCGIVGGPLMDPAISGRVLGEEALKRLRGQSTSAATTIPAARHAPLVFDERQLERWGIPESRLPAGSTVEFRPPSLWRDRRPEVIGALAVGAVQMLLVIGLLFERKRRHVAERDTRRHLLTAAHLDRRAVAGELAASLAHELNQPLGAIIQNTEAAELMLKSRSLAPEDLREILADIRKDDMRAAEIIRKMRNLLRKQELTLQMVNLNELATETAEMIAVEATARGVTVDMQLARGLAETAGDRVHLKQVLLNLLLNSLHAVALQQEDHRRIIVRTGRRDGNVEVIVTDTGAGIPPDQLSRIFEPFFTTKGDGLGVGLSIARTIVQAHEGQIRAENNVGKGATVRFWLPIKNVRSA